jgi:uncharacterized membrane protein
MGFSLRLARAALLAIITAISLHFLDAAGLGWGIAGLVLLLGLINELGRWVILAVGAMAIWAIAHTAFGAPTPADLMSPSAPVPVQSSPSTPAPGHQPPEGLSAQLQELEDAHARGLITDEEFRRLRLRVLERTAQEGQS